MIEGESYRMKERERTTAAKRRGRPKKETGTTQEEPKEVPTDA